MISNVETAKKGRAAGVWGVRVAALAMATAAAAACASRDAATNRATAAASEDCEAEEAALTTPEARAAAARPVSWVSPEYRRERKPVPVKILGINDFHGQITATRKVAGRPVGGAAVLASYLKAAQAGVESRTLLVHAGDQVGASPPSPRSSRTSRPSTS